MPHFRKKPVIIEAVRLTKDNADVVVAWMGGPPAGRVVTSHRHSGQWDAVEIETREGALTASPGDWVIRGAKGEYSYCRADIFQQTYEAVQRGEVPGATVETRIETVTVERS